MRIRVAAAAELPLLQDIERAAGEHFRTLGMTAIADDDPLPLDVLETYRSAGRAWVAVDDADRPVAYLLSDPVDGAAHIEQVSVHPDAARRGVGRALIEHLAETARQEGLAALTLTTFAEVPWNAPYYARLGFRPLADSDPDLTEGLREISRAEAAHGLAAWPRVCMRRELGPGHREVTRDAYDGFTELYASMFADRLETRPFARAMVHTFAELVRAAGPLRTADVGCGPGHLTALLHEVGLDAFGIDLSPGMVAHARRAHPELRFEEGRMEALPVEDGALGGILAHYSMIHTPPAELPALLAEQVRALAPGGLLLVSFFGLAETGAEPVRFDHKVAPAYAWPVDRFAGMLADAGLVPFATLAHDPASERGYLDAHVMARRP